VAAEGLKWRVNRAVRASTLPAPARLIMFVLSDMADAKTAEIPAERTPSLGDLAEQTGLSEATVKRHLPTLESLGWVVPTRPTAAEQARHVSTRYRLAIPSGGSERAPETPDPGAQGEPPAGAQSEPPNENRGLRESPRGGSECTPAGAQSEPPSFNDHNDQLHDQLLPPDGSDDGALFGAPATTPKSAPKKPPKAKPAPKPAEEPAPVAPRFDEFWAVYPKRQKRAEAEAAWTRSIEDLGIDAQLIIDVAAKYARTRLGQDAQYTALGASWLNAKRWTDEYPEPVLAANGHIPFQDEPGKDFTGGFYDDYPYPEGA
jgi:hypothetical protein